MLRSIVAILFVGVGSFLIAAQEAQQSSDTELQIGEFPALHGEGSDKSSGQASSVPSSDVGNSVNSYHDYSIVVHVKEEDVPAYMAYNRANELGRAGAPIPEVIAAYVAALDLKWSIPEAHMNLANLLMRAGQTVEAVQHHWYSVVFARSGSSRADALCNLAIALRRFPSRIAEFQDAIARSRIESAYDEALASCSIDRQTPDHLCASQRASGMHTEHQTNVREAKDHNGLVLEPRTVLLDALRADSTNVCSLNLLAGMHTDEREFDDALVYLSKAADAHPSNPIVLMNMGNHFAHHGRFAEALPWYERALAVVAKLDGLSGSIDPDELVLLFSNTGHSLRETGMAEKALKSYWAAKWIIYNQIVAAHPVVSHAGPLSPSRHFLPLQSLGDCDTPSGSTSTKNAMGSDYCYSSRVADFVNQRLWTNSNILAMQGISSNWSHLELIEHELVQDIEYLLQYEKRRSSNGLETFNELGRPMNVDLYTFSLQRFVEPLTDLKLASSSAGGCSAGKVTSSISFGSSTKRCDGKEYESRHPRLRVGYLSYDWRDHPMGRLTSYLVTHHNATLFDVICFYYGPKEPPCDETARARGACYQEYFINDCPVFVDMALASQSEALDALCDFELDLVIDLTAHTTGGRIQLAANHPGRIVMNYLGYPGTTGCDGFDYNLVDRVVVPPDYLSSAFSEKLIYLPLPYQANNMPDLAKAYELSYWNSREEQQPGAMRTCACLNDMFRSDGAFASQRPTNSLSPHCCKRDIIQNPYLDMVSFFGSRETASYLRDRVDFTWLCAFNSNKKIEPVSLHSKLLFLYYYSI
jgi:tetratricopeptide (TPR) repeat protein